MPKNNRKAADNDVVYMVQRATDGAIKFGVTSNPRKRINALANQHKSEMVVLGFTLGKLERVILGKFKEYELYTAEMGHQCEWFKPDPIVLGFATLMYRTVDEVPRIEDMPFDEYMALHKRVQDYPRPAPAPAASESEAAAITVRTHESEAA